MNTISAIRIRPKLLLLLVITGLIPLLVVGYYSSRLTTTALLDKSFNQLQIIQEIRRAEVEGFFQTTATNLRSMAESDRIINLLSTLKTYQANANTTDGDGLDVESALYATFTKLPSKPLEKLIKTYNYADLYIIDDSKGLVLFSLSGKEDLGTNLSSGPQQKSGLAEIWRKTMASKNTTWIDFAPYAPAANEESAFLGHPIRNRDGVFAGVLVFRFGPEIITRTVQSRAGMGESGESYLLGYLSDQKRFEFRSNVETMGKEAILGSSLAANLDYWQDAVRRGVAGGSGMYHDATDKEVLVAFNRLNLEGLDWYLISKLDKYEITTPVRAIDRQLALVAILLLLLIALGAVYLSRSITRPIIAGMEFAHAIADGDFHSTLPSNRKDELGDLANSLNGMARNLRELDWLKSGKEGLDDLLRGEHNIRELAQKCITFFVKHLGAELGAIYVQHGNYLELQASYAFTDRQGSFNRFAYGEGMVGQAALENQVLTYREIKDGAPAINYGAGERIPLCYAAVPISFKGNVVGVILLGANSTFSELQHRFIEQNAANTGILFNAAQSREKIKQLLQTAEAQQKELNLSNEELEEQARILKQSEAQLQTQQEELRVTNEELEEQTKALRQSEAELQAQQEELRVTNEELEERTKALEQQKEKIKLKNLDLIRAQEAVYQKAVDLENANRYKSEFLANMSHELRTPLNSVLILSQLLAGNKDGNLTDKQRESASTIYSSGSELLSLINEILDLSKIEAGKVELVIEEVPLESIVNDTKRLFKDLAADKGISMVIDIADDLPELISTDSQRLQQVIRNLMANAFKFTPQGKVSLKVFRPGKDLLTGSLLQPATSLAFSVVDEGIGIPTEKQQAIFEAFRQADGSTNRRYGGTGLGLSISKELTKLLGGNMHLASVEGQGSTFTIIIPERYQGASADKRQELTSVDDLIAAPRSGQVTPDRPRIDVASPSLTTTSPAEEAAIAALFLEDDRKLITPESKSLLIIEDDPGFAKIMRDFSRDHDFKCLLADSGETGLHLASYYKPSAIILDIDLPGIDGWTVMERLKETPDLRHIPVHFMSAHDNTLDAMRMGAIGYLTKPVSLDKIETAFAKIETTLSRPVSRLLLVEDDPTQQNSIRMLIEAGDVEITAVATGREAFAELEKGAYDCMILDLGLLDMSGFELLEKIRKSETSTRVPIIVYTGRDLSRDEENQLKRYAESIIIKGVKSPERLLDESALFLHRVEANLPEDKRKMLKLIHDKESVLTDKTILLVDDDMRNVFALSSVLEDKKMKVVVARNGLECLEKLKTNSTIDAVLMDIMMPKMDGFEAMREIRKEARFARLPIIALTAKAMKGDRNKCIEAGANDYLAKPINNDKLLSMMRVWLY